MESQRAKKSRSLGIDSKLQPQHHQKPVPKRPELGDRHNSAPSVARSRQSPASRSAGASESSADVSYRRQSEAGIRDEPVIYHPSSRSDHQRGPSSSSKDVFNISARDEPCNLNLIVVGNDGVGKSSFIRNAFDLRKPAPTPISSSKVSLAGVVHRVQLLELLLNDLDFQNGQEISWPRYVNNVSFPSIDGVLCLYDVRDRDSITGVPQFLSAVSKSHIPCALVACKIDAPISEHLVSSSFTERVAKTFPNIILEESCVQSPENAKRCLLAVLRPVLALSSAPSTRRPSKTGELGSREPSTARKPAPSRTSSTSRSRSRSRFPPSQPKSKDQLLAASRQRMIDPKSGDESVDDGDDSTEDDTATMFHRSKLLLRVNTKKLSDPPERPTGPYTPVSPTDPPTSRLTSPLERRESVIPETPDSQRLTTNLRPGTAGTTDSRADHTFLYMDEESLDESPEHKAVTATSVNKVIEHHGNQQGGGVAFSDLVRKLLSLPTSKGDSKFVPTFLCLYRAFATPSQLLASIIDQFVKVEKSELVNFTKIAEQLRYLQVLGQWTASYPGDFATSPVRDIMLAFVSNIERSKSLAPAAKEIGNNMQVLVNDEDASWAFTTSTSSTRSRGSSTTYKTMTSSSASESISAHNSRPSKLTARSSNNDMDSDASVSDTETHQSHSSPRHSGAPSSASSLLKLSNMSSQSAANLLAIEHAREEAKKFKLSPHIRMGKAQWHQFMETPIDELAREITRIDWTMYSAIRPRDFVRHVMQPSTQKKVPGTVDNINMMVQHFNHLSFFVSGMILLRDKPKHRSKALEKFMALAWKVRQLNNYNSLGAIVAGVDGQEIERLGQTHELVPNETQKQFLRLKILMGHSKAYAAYRMAWENSSAERIPFIPLVRKDMTLAASTSDTFVGTNINWKKFVVMGEVVINIQKSHEQAYSFPERTQRSQEVVRLILETQVVSDPEDSADPRSELYDRSIQIEPQPGSDTKKKFDWLRR